MILLEIPNWFAQVFGIGVLLIAFALLLIFLWAIFVEYLWQSFSIYRAIFYAMWDMKHSHRDWFEIKMDGKLTKWKRVKK